MQIAHVRIENILGIEELEFSPAGFTQISGGNGKGKTSILEAIKATLRAGHDATLLRAGAKKGEVVLVLDDGTEISRKVTETGSDTVIKRDGKKVAKPVDALRQITDALSVNPVDFLAAKPTERVRVLLESLPLTADVPRLETITGMRVTARPGVHALTLIEEVRKAVYDERTGTNRAVREKGNTITTLRQALPPETSGAAGDEKELEAKLGELDAWLAAEKKRIDNKLEDLRKERDGKISATQTRIAELQSQIANLQGDIAAEREAFTATEGKANIQRQKNQDKYNADALPVRSALQRIRDDREAYGRRQQTLDTIGALDTELEALEAQAAVQTQAIEAIDAYKLELLSALPIEGLEVREGELFRHGVPFDRLNTAQQVQIAVELAKVRAGELGVVCVDRIECLDSSSLEEFRAQAEDSGLQLFITRVADTELTIGG